MSKIDFGELVHGVEVLRAGSFTASNGTRWTFSEDDLAELARKYDTAYSEAPVVIGHPALNGPAYGWVKGLSVSGDRLLADLDLVPEFVEVVRRGLFKKRSASIYHDLDGKGPYLRHVGFLGANPPAIKGLADLNLADGESLIFEFSEKERAMSWKEKVKTLFTQVVDEIPEAGAGTVIVQQPAPKAASFTEEDVLKREEAAARKAKEEAEASFAEQKRTWEVEQAARAHQDAVREKFNGLVRAGKVAPAWVKSGIVEFAQSLASSEAVEFAEAGKKTPYEWFVGFVEGLPKLIELGEVATREKDPGKTSDAAARLEALIRKKMEGDHQMSYSFAFAEVQRENPDLAAEYLSGFKA